MGEYRHHIDVGKRETVAGQEAAFGDRAIQERDFLRYNYRTDINAIKLMARELVELGWVKQDLSSKVDDYVDQSFLSKATGLPPSELSTW